MKPYRIGMVASLLCIAMLLGHQLLKPNAVGMLLYLVLPLPLSILVFLHAFRDYMDSRR